MGESQGPTAVTVSVIFGSVMLVVMTFRMFTRVYVVGVVGPDDILMVIAAILAWAFIACTIIAVNHGLGSHIADVMARGPVNLVQYSKTVWFSSIFYNACLGFIKTSVLALYMRLGDRVLKKMAMAMAGIVSCQWIANVATCIFQCSPIPAAWDVAITKKRCVDINAFYLSNAALNIVTDLLTYTLPMGLVLKLQLPRKQRIALGVMLCLGLFACVSSMVRISFIPKMLKSSDPTWTIAQAMYWSAIETNVGIVAASIPSLKALAQRYLPVILGEYSSNRNRNAYPMHNSKGSFNQLGSSGHRSKVSGKRNTSYTTRSFNDPDKISDDGDSEKFAETPVTRDNISQERLHIPGGRIMATTEITTTSVTAPDDGKSFYSHTSDDQRLDSRMAHVEAHPGMKV